MERNKKSEIRNLTFSCPPYLGMGVAGPEALEDDLVLGLVAGAAWLHEGGGGQRAVVLTDGVGQPTVVHVPDVLPLYYHGPQLGF
jgi:hypothetical protein